MEFPNFNEEKKLWRKGFNVVVGLDEAGRGPLAGPVVAAAVSINPKFETLNSKQAQSPNFKNSKRVLSLNNLDLFRIYDLGFRISDMRDSKKLSEKQREFFYNILTSHHEIQWGVGIVSERVIDKINILEATKLAMWKSLEDIASKIDGRQFLKQKTFLILDGNFRINSKLPQKPIIGADGKVFSCAAAGIIAKVTRDQIMQKYHKKYPGYGFNRHKGYGTKLHVKQLEILGPAKIHRKTFYPVNSY